MLPKVEFSLAVYTAEESDGFVEITLSISPPPNDTTTLRSVLFSTVDGTAMGEKLLLLPCEIKLVLPM